MLIEQVQVPGEDTVNETHKKIRLTLIIQQNIVWSQRWEIQCKKNLWVGIHPIAVRKKQQKWFGY